METLDLLFFESSIASLVEPCTNNEQNQICRSNNFLQLIFSSFFCRTRFDDSKPFWKRGQKFPWGPKSEALTVPIWRHITLFFLFYWRRIKASMNPRWHNDSFMLISDVTFKASNVQPYFILRTLFHSHLCFFHIFSFSFLTFFCWSCYHQNASNRKMNKIKVAEYL